MIITKCKFNVKNDGQYEVWTLECTQISTCSVAYDDEGFYSLCYDYHDDQDDNNDYEEENDYEGNADGTSMREEMHKVCKSFG